ncbi:hypothetical protein MASR2M8_05540 [Opitutaceae bacterium]
MLRPPAAVAACVWRSPGFEGRGVGADPARTTFLATADGVVLIELHSNTAAPIATYGQKHPLELHLAFSSEDLARSAIA